jgi:periplasmic copper chaperone A
VTTNIRTSMNNLSSRFYPRVSAFICGSVLACTAAIADVRTTNAWVRGTVPAQTTTGAFLTVTSSEDAKLVGVSTPIAQTAEIHKTENHAGMMHMDEVRSLELPAGKPVALQPGGYHVMLMGVKAPVKEGAKVPLKLTIEDRKGKRTTVDVQATVRPLGQ